MPDHVGEDYKTSDSSAAVVSTNREEPLATEEDEAYVELHGGVSNASSSPDKEIDEDPDACIENIIKPTPGAPLDRTKSTATTASGISILTTAEAEPPKKWYQKLNPLRWSAARPVPAEREVCKEYNAPFLSTLVFQWINPLMTTGYKRPLEHNDIYTVNPDRTTDRMVKKVKASLKKRVERGDKYPLIWALHETYKFEFWLGGICQLFANIFQVISPFTLRYLIQFADDAYIAAKQGKPIPHIGIGIGLVVGITVMQMLQSLGTNQFIYRGMMVGGQSRAVLISIIFEKAMRISGRAKAGGKAIEEGVESEKGGAAVEEKAGKKGSKKGSKKGAGADAPPDAGKGISGDGTGWGNGRVVNLMSVDTFRVDQASGMFHMIWTAPIACIITLVVLLINLTYSALAGFGLLVVGMPLLTKAIKTLFKKRKAINKITDQRVSLTQEILQAVRFVKYFGWETAFLGRLEDIRKREIQAIQVLLAIRNAIMAVSMSLPIFASMLAFICYSLTSHSLNPAKVFSSLALFNSLRMPLNLLPLVIGQVVDAWSSVKRIQEYLLCEEMDEEAIFDPDGENALEMHDASFTWERTVTQEPEQQMSGKPGAKPDGKEAKKALKQPAKEEKAEKAARKSKDEESGDTTPTDNTSIDQAREPFKLHDMDFTIGRNELVAVIGSVGSGKSSLLAALAGDMRKTSGEVVMGASRAFCPQYAWIQNATLKDNILFGKDMNKSWYRKVIDACALQPDLDMLPNGDMTEIGERGINVSGGQKQRLNIARAIYFDADIVLMDDPLSAVDAHVGRHIFDHAILGLLKDKCRVLATHQLWVLNRCDRIIWMEEGKIQAVGTFNELMESKDFKHLMETTAVEEQMEEEDKVSEDEVEDEKKDSKKRKLKGAALMQAEERAVKSVPWAVYAAYIRASGSIFNIWIVLGFLIFSQGANIITSLWLSYWVSNKFHLDTGTYIGIYAALGFIQALSMFLFSLSLTILGTKASRVMLHQAITRALRAPMSFYDTTPLGRITNRFSRDVDVMDNNLSDAIRMYFLTMAMINSVFILIIAFFHYFAIALVPLMVLFVFSASYYRASAREMKRFESVFRSSMFAKFSEGLSGTACIRAYGLQTRFIHSIRDSIDEMDSAYFLTFANQRWLSVRLDAIGNLLVFTTGILVVTSRFNVSPAISGLVLSYILAIVQMMQFTVRQLAEVENGMNATERLHYYGTQLEEEAPLTTVPVRPSWPESGEIIFQDVQMRYRAGLPLVLNDLSMHVKGGERIGIVGRTGAGKSSIMSALFRLVELSGGSITVDGLDISKIGLHDLRFKLAIIPQDPTLFRGTIRSNLDPFSEHTDLELWDAMKQSDLVPRDADPAVDKVAPTGSSAAATGRIHLDSIVEEEGLNFSLGQRQLMALARALVRNSQIIVCDEATSSVDMETDDKIQETMKRGFRNKTVLCIAHRLRTIVGYDRVVVMEAGGIAEMGTPKELWEVVGGRFRGMCERGGVRREDVFGVNA